MLVNIEEVSEKKDTSSATDVVAPAIRSRKSSAVLKPVSRSCTHHGVFSTVQHTHSGVLYTLLRVFSTLKKDTTRVSNTRKGHEQRD